MRAKDCSAVIYQHLLASPHLLFLQCLLVAARTLLCACPAFVADASSCYVRTPQLKAMMNDVLIVFHAGVAHRNERLLITVLSFSDVAG